MLMNDRRARDARDEMSTTRGLVFALGDLARFVPPLLARGFREAGVSIARFANGELHLALDTPPAGQDCVVLGAIAPPDDRLLSTLLLCHTLRKDGAGRIVAALPYLAYARQDRREAGRSLGAAWVGQLLSAAGADEVVTIDVHSPLVASLVPLRLRSLSPAPLFAAAIAALALEAPTIVAPDAGARARCEAVRGAAGIARPVVWFDKQRTAAGVRHLTLHGAVGDTVVLVDDILDTGSTLVSACEALAGAGMQRALVMVTHGLFTGTGWQRLWSLGVTRIFCTDTVAGGAPVRPEITVLGTGSLLADALAERPRPNSE